jgi:hypothetical protein
MFCCESVYGRVGIVRARSREEFHVVIAGRVLQFEEQTSALLVGSVRLNKYAWGPGGWRSPWLPAGQDISTSNMCFRHSICCFNVLICVSAVVTCFHFSDCFLGFSACIAEAYIPADRPCHSKG